MPSADAAVGCGAATAEGPPQQQGVLPRQQRMGMNMKRAQHAQQAQHVRRAGAQERQQSTELLTEAAMHLLELGTGSPLVLPTRVTFPSHVAL